MRADHHLRRAVLDRRAHLPRLRGPEPAVQCHDVDVGHPLLHGAEVLRRQHRGGREHCALPAVQHGPVHGPHGHFRLAKADVSADEAVHGLRPPAHVDLHVIEALQLIRRRRVLKGVCEGLHLRAVDPAGDPLPSRALHVQAHHLRRQALGLGGHFVQLLLPAPRIHRAPQRHSLAGVLILACAVAHEALGLQNVQFHVGVGHLDDQRALPLLAQAQKFADAEVRVHHIVATEDTQLLPGRPDPQRAFAVSSGADFAIVQLFNGALRLSLQCRKARKRASGRHMSSEGPHEGAGERSARK
mmetsp:Transcript_18242/g.69158  ORF Transcript_18242/g.69158 Transcript_18242/m.69158 type:complete len:300 (+) Transcript_18242:509-1408(+)